MIDLSEVTRALWESQLPAWGMAATHALEAERAWFAGELEDRRERGRKSRVSDASPGRSERCGAGVPADEP